MPELAEVARIVHFIRKHLVGKTLANVQAQNDDIVYGKVGTSAAEFQKAMQGNKVIGAGQQGKYFWITMSKPPHVVMHFGMTGWMKIRNADTYYYRTTNADDKEWPPKYWKFLLETDENPKTEAAFVDPRRLARIRLVDCPADEIRQYTPLKENGPDPVTDKDILTIEWLQDKIKSKRVPIKALLLDQANISGIGNWMGDEILYHSKIHPEQYSNTLTDEQIKQLHTSIDYVCTTSVGVLADSEQFPEEWLFKHRWGKGKKNQPSVLPNGNKIVFLTVGGRTSAVVPSVQRKTGPVAKEISDEDLEDNKETKVAVNGKRKRAAVKEEEEDKDAIVAPKRAASRRGNRYIEATNLDSIQTCRECTAYSTTSPSDMRCRVTSPIQWKCPEKVNAASTGNLSHNSLQGFHPRQPLNDSYVSNCILAGTRFIRNRPSVTCAYCHLDYDRQDIV